MRSFAFYERVSRAFHDYPSLSKVLVLFTVRYSLCFFIFYFVPFTSSLYDFFFL